MKKNNQFRKVDDDVIMKENEDIVQITPQNVTSQTQNIVMETTLTESVMDGLINEFKQLQVTPKLEFTKTDNGAITLKSSGSCLLDFFSKCGSLRKKPAALKELFLSALAENPSYAMKCLFYMRDIRGGLGERWSFRTLMRMLSTNEKLMKFAIRNLPFIPEYGRFDDIVYAFERTKVEKIAFKFLKEQCERDIDSKKPSLLAKWMPSENTSSKNTKRLASRVMKEWEYPARKYRKTLSNLRKKISIVETKMSNSKWTHIDYSKLPSLALKKYNKAFNKHDNKGYKGYLNDVKKGVKKMNTSTLYPYDIVRKFLHPIEKMDETEEESLDLMWKNMPNYIPKGENSIVVVDTSGSMMEGQASVTPICVAISLGLYIGERMPLNGFITFSAEPLFNPIIGNTLKEKVNNMMKAHWEMSTNLQKVFELILQMQIKNRKMFMGNDAIKKIYIISDMQFDSACNDNKKTNYALIKKKYNDAKLPKPKLIFWNVNAKKSGVEVSSNEEDTFLVSGCSPSILKTALTSNPYNYMMEVLKSNRYEKIH